MIFRLFCTFLFLQTSSAYIFYLNDSEYVQMPPVFHLDPFENCIHDNNDTGVYCSAKFALINDGPSNLNDMIRNYSAKTESHFNHSDLYYGICITKTCNYLYEQNTTSDLGVILEECLNNSLWEDYKLQAQIEKYWCEKHTENLDFSNLLDKLDTSDLAVAGGLSVLLVLNLIGSLQEICCKKKCCQGGTAFFSCFSIRRNWLKLTAAPGEGPEPRLTRLKGLHGMKSIAIGMVIAGHSFLPIVANADNTHFFEEGYREWYYLLIANGSIVVQSFFVMSGFLLAYNLLLHSEKHKISFIVAPKIIIMRYIRLTVPFAVVLAVIATWVRHFSIGTGPLWQSIVMTEVSDCRRDWWLNLLYINNYVDYSNCMTHTWYLASDFQLFILGVIICVLTSGICRKFILALLLLAGMVMPAVHTYLRDLDGTLIFSPEASRNMLIKDETFNHVYKRGHTNLAAFVVGLGLGQLVYHWQTFEHKFQKSIIRRLMILLSFPAILFLCALCGLFYRDAPRESVYIRMVFAAFLKPAFSGVIAFLIIGMVFKFEDFCRGILEWRGWAVPSRISYCAYIIHVLIIKLLTGTGTTLSHASFLHICEILISSVAMSFMTAVPLHLFVEAPTLQLLKHCTSGRPVENDNYTINKTIDALIQNGRQEKIYEKPNRVTSNKEMTEISRQVDMEINMQEKETIIDVLIKENTPKTTEESTENQIQDNKETIDKKQITVEDNV